MNLMEHWPACPACGTMHYPGAEADYLEHLDDVKEQLQNLDKVHGKVAGREAKKQGKRILVVAAVILALAAVFGGVLYYWEHQYDRDFKADYLWQQENFPQWDQWYENGEYDQLLNAYLTALDENREAWSYAHYDFCNIYMCISEVEETLKELSEDNVVVKECWRMPHRAESCFPLTIAGCFMMNLRLFCVRTGTASAKKI